MYIKILTPEVCPLLSGAIYMYKIILKMCIKSDLREIIFKFATNGKEKKLFCCHQDFVIKGFSAPALGLYTCIKALKYISGPGVRLAFIVPLVLWFKFGCFYSNSALW